MELILKDKEYGKEYLVELKKVLKIRKEKRLIYGDSFKKEKIENLLAIIDGKMGRALVVKKINGISHPKFRDEISDIINYLFFVLYKITTNKEK